MRKWRSNSKTFDWLQPAYLPSILLKSWPFIERIGNETFFWKLSKGTFFLGLSQGTWLQITEFTLVHCFIWKHWNKSTLRAIAFLCLLLFNTIFTIQLRTCRNIRNKCLNKQPNSVKWSIISTNIWLLWSSVMIVYCDVYQSLKLSQN